MSKVSTIPLIHPRRFAQYRIFVHLEEFSLGQHRISGFGERHPTPSFTHASMFCRFITPIFLHAGIIHILLNMVAQLLVSAQLEREMGSGGFFFVYFAAGIFGLVANPPLQWPRALANMINSNLKSLAIFSEETLLWLVFLLLVRVARFSGLSP